MKASSFYLTLAVGMMITPPIWADAPVVPGAGFTASRYEALWTKSPFSVASSEIAPESPDYSLVGIAKMDGVDYASLIDKRNQQHLLVQSGKPVNGLTLVSVSRGQNPADAMAVLQRDSQSITLKLEAAPVSSAAVPQAPMPMPMPMPGSGVQTSEIPSEAPMPRARRPLIHLPPRPPPSQPPPQAPPPPPPTMQR